jgi:ABC-type bacteriocin/lantibiotic exporter with double-glycine peptidase domain
MLGIIVLILLPPITLLGNSIGKKMAKLTEKYMQRSDILFNIINKIIKCISIIKTYSIENMFQDEFNHNSTAKFILENEQIKYRSFFSGLMDLFMGLPFIIIYILSSVLYTTKTLTVGTIMMFLQLLNKITVPFVRLNSILIQYRQTKVSLTRLNDVLDSTDEEQDAKLILQEELECIKFNQVSFMYDHKNIIENLTLDIKIGKYYGIIGENGSGKSTFIKLLLQLYTPHSGEIDFNEHNYELLSIESLRKNKKFVYVEENPMLLFEKFDKNIILDRDKNEESFMEIINTTGISKIYNDSINKNIEEVSNGQKQRIALARALYNLGKNSILVLDEPFSSLDPNIIKELESIILEYKQINNLTIFEITHNFNDMERFDHIYYFEDGKVIMEGSHEMLKSNLQYSQFISNYKK